MDVPPLFGIYQRTLADSPHLLPIKDLLVVVGMREDGERKSRSAESVASIEWRFVPGYTHNTSSLPIQVFVLTLQRNGSIDPSHFKEKNLFV